jgi:adenylate cyclase
LAYRYTGRYAEAVATAKEARSQSPEYLPAHINLALGSVEQWIAQQSPDSQTLVEAFAATQRVIALTTSSPWGHMHLGTVYLWQKQYEQALAEMEQGIALGPNLADSYVLLAEVLGHVGRAMEAVRMGEQALRLKPLAVDEHLYGIGVAYTLAGYPDEALAPLQRYLSRYPNILDAHLTLAAVYSELDRDAEARAEATEVLRINPRFSLEVHKQSMPIKDPAVLERHLAALRKARLK